MLAASLSPTHTPASPTVLHCISPAGSLPYPIHTAEPHGVSLACPLYNNLASPVQAPGVINYFHTYAPTLVSSLTSTPSSLFTLFFVLLSFLRSNQSCVLPFPLQAKLSVFRHIPSPNADVIVILECARHSVSGLACSVRSNKPEITWHTSSHPLCLFSFWPSVLSFTSHFHIQMFSFTLSSIFYRESCVEDADIFTYRFKKRFQYIIQHKKCVVQRLHKWCTLCPQEGRASSFFLY